MFNLLAQLEFEYAARLFWLAALPVVAYFAWRTKVSGPTWRRLAIWFCRSAGLVLLILADGAVCVNHDGANAAASLKESK